MSDHGDAVAGGNREAHAMQDLPLGLVKKVRAPEFHRRRPGREFRRARAVLDLAVLGEEAKHPVHVEQRLLDLAVHHAEEVERDVELDEKAVHQHQVAEGEALRRHAFGHQQHQRRHRNGDDEALADVEQAERSLVLHRRRFVALQVLVVAPRLELLVAEVLHRLVIQQAVDGARVRPRVELVGAPADLHAPLGDQHREPDVDGDRAEGDGGKAPVELLEQHRLLHDEGHGHVRQLGGDQAGECRRHAPLVFQQIGQEDAQRAPFVAPEPLGRRGALVCLRSHAYIVSSRKGENMGLRLKFNLVLLAVFVTGLGVTGYISYELLHKNARDEVLRNAGVMLEASLSMRQYTIGRVRPLLPYDADKFLPESVPAFAATEIMSLLRKKYPDYAYKEATLNPTNPRDRAVDWEADIVNAFRKEAPRGDISGIRGTPTGRSLYLARPLQIKDQACLACHTTAEMAPPAMVKLYGPSNGFGWKMDGVIV